MANINLNINPDETIRNGEKLSYTAGLYNKEINTIYSVIDDLKAAWSGTAAEKFIRDIEDFKVNYVNFGKTMTQLGELLVAIGKDYQKAEEDLSSRR